METWRGFEKWATECLNKKYSSTNLRFKDIGGSNANKPDIEVYKNDNHIFNLEVKLSPSQSGQFVINIKENQFVFSSQNLFSKNEYSQQIIDYLNQNFEKYKDVEQSAISIECSSDLFEKWIINHYKNKNSKFIIVSRSFVSTSMDEDSKFISVVPIEQISEYFNIEANLRRKMSGTRSLPKSERKEMKEIIKRYLSNLGGILNAFETLGKRTFILTDKNLLKQQRYFGEKLYYLSPIEKIKNVDEDKLRLKLKNSGKDIQDQHIYFIRKRSMTNNINVIFSLTYNGANKNVGFHKLEKAAKKY